jgi:hypothetical protein
MKTFVMDVVLRGDDPDGGEMPEWTTHCTSIRADDEVASRRQVLEKAWSRGMLVSRFKNVLIQNPKPH